MTEEEQKAREIVNSLKEWGKIHFIVKDRSYARLNYDEVYLILTLISKLQADIEIKDKVIDLMAKKINEAYFEENNMWVWFEKEIIPKNEQGKFDYKDIGTRKQRIKQYFYKKVEEENNVD